MHELAAMHNAAAANPFDFSAAIARSLQQSDPKKSRAPRPRAPRGLAACKALASIFFHEHVTDGEHEELGQTTTNAKTYV